LSIEGVLNQIEHNLETTPLRQSYGKVTQVIGSVIHGVVSGVKMGEICTLRTPDEKDLTAEVVGLSDGHAVLFPYHEIEGVSEKTKIIPTGNTHKVKVGPGLLGKVLDGFGKPIDGTLFIEGIARNVKSQAPNPLDRQLCNQVLSTGVKAIDGLLTVAKGQRMGIFAAPGIGKSSLLSMLAKGVNSDVLVIAMIGERGREVREFIEHAIPEEVREKTIIIVATSDKSAMERVKAAEIATTIAESFRDDGKHVLFLMDSITRFARSLREIGLSAGEPPTRRGFPPSVFRELPRLVERTGPGAKGVISAFYSVLVEGDDMNEPVADEVKSLLDGQITLSAKLAAEGHYPAIDIGSSISRVMPKIISEEHLRQSQRFRTLLAKYEDIRLLHNIGEYKEGTCADSDAAIQLKPKMDAFLKQPLEDLVNFDEIAQAMRGIVENEMG